MPMPMPWFNERVSTFTSSTLSQQNYSLSAGELLRRYDLADVDVPRAEPAPPIDGSLMDSLLIPNPPMPRCDRCELQAVYQNVKGNFCWMHWHELKPWLTT